MASQKLLFTLFFVTGAMIICYVYVSKRGDLSYRDGVFSAKVLAKGKQFLGAREIKSRNFTSRKPKVDWKEYWRHVEEKKLMGFQEKPNILENNFITAKEVKKNIIIKNKEGKANIKPITVKPIQKKWLYNWDERKETAESIPLYGNWKDKMAQRIIFNRVGKCGSRSVLDVFKYLATKNKYNMINSVVYNQTRLSEAKKNLIVSVLLKVDPPFLFQRHLYYVDFSKFSSVTVKYINIIRDPIERFTSHYYFKRFGDGKSDTRQFKGTEQDRYQTINECVLRRRSECSLKKLQYIVPFFCGQSSLCRSTDREPLEIAKRNVERDFIVVGLLEELEDTFSVLEKMVPRFFTGAVDYLKDPGNTFSRNRSATSTKYKESPSEEVRAILLQQMELEYEFYYYIKDRFHKLKSQLGIGDNTLRGTK